MYSTFRCIGGSQVIDPSMFTSEIKAENFLEKYPLYEPNLRTCMFTNLCWVNKRGLIYYQDPNEIQELPIEYLISTFNNNLVYAGVSTPNTLVIRVESSTVPTNIAYDESEISFYDANSNSYNYAHYLLDNVFPHFAAAELFDVPFEGTKQIFETSCRHFGKHGERIAHGPIPYNMSLGSFRSACLHRLNHMWAYFFDYAPRYLEPVYSNDVCFHNVIAGQGAMLGLRSVNPSRAIHFRNFRNYVMTKLVRYMNITSPEQKNIILVGIRSVGHTTDQVPNLCRIVNDALKEAMKTYITMLKRDRYKVKCIVNQDMLFHEEIIAVQEAKIIISVYGTISYMSLFARDGTMQISLNDPNSKWLKDVHTLTYATHIQLYYLPWNETSKLSGILKNSMKRINNREKLKEKAQNQKEYNKNKSIVTDKPEVKYEFADMRPVNGTLVRTVARDSDIYLYADGQLRAIKDWDKLAALGYWTDPVNGYRDRDIYVIRDYEVWDLPKGANI